MSSEQVFLDIVLKAMLSKILWTLVISQSPVSWRMNMAPRVGFSMILTLDDMQKQRFSGDSTVTKFDSEHPSVHLVDKIGGRIVFAWLK